MGCLGLFLLIIIALPMLFLLAFLNVITLSYGKMGLSFEVVLALLFATLAGSMINIPISRRRIEFQRPRPFFQRFFFYQPPQVTYQVIAVNVGGAIIPLVFSLYLLPRVPLWLTLLATAVVTVVARLLARPVVGIGIVMPAWIPPIFAAVLALLLARDSAAPVAYISGVVGTLVGADLLHWPSFKKLGAHYITIGGAGVFDGIFLSGIIAVLITSL